MTKEEMSVYLNKEYAEANRYMDNAKRTLNKAGKGDDGFYNDAKYVRSACGTAYLGVLIALEAWLTTRGVDMPNPKKKNRSIDFYTAKVSKIDGAMLKYLNSAYNVLHLEGYYRYETNVKVITGGFDSAYTIINRIKPDAIIDVKDTRMGALKRTLNTLLIPAFGLPG